MAKNEIFFSYDESGRDALMMLCGLSSAQTQKLLMRRETYFVLLSLD